MKVLRWGAVAAATFAIVGCASRETPKQATQPPVSCPTVVLFDEQFERPMTNVPEEWRVFSGRWGNGAWDGKLCHEIVVEAVYPNGTARVVDMQGEYSAWGAWPTAFRRQGVFTENGELLVQIGDETVTYRHQNGVIVGEWNRGQDADAAAVVTLHPMGARATGLLSMN